MPGRPPRILQGMASESAVLQRLIGWVVPQSEVDWEAAYADQLPRVYNYLRYRLGNAADAEDLTSRTFEKAWVARHRYRRDLGSFGTWIMTIARRVAIDHARRARPLVSLERAAEIAGGPSPEELAEGRSEAALLARLLEGLPERDRELVALKYGAGLSHRAIGQMMGLSETNVGSLLHRAVKVLRAEWEKSGG